jgi:hypothetical protein
MDKTGLVGNHQAACTGWAKGTSAVAAVAVAVVAKTVVVVAEAAVAEATVPVVVAVAVTPTLFEGETFVARVGIPAVGKAGPEAEALDPSLDRQSSDRTETQPLEDIGLDQDTRAVTDPAGTADILQLEVAFLLAGTADILPLEAAFLQA